MKPEDKVILYDSEEAAKQVTITGWASRHSHLSLQKYCMWVSGDGYYETECDNAFTFTAGGPGEDGFIYCPYCGGRLVKAYGANGFEPDSAMQYGNDIVLAQHEETGRVWKGYRSSVPPGYFIIRGEMEPSV